LKTDTGLTPVQPHQARLLVKLEYKIKDLRRNLDNVIQVEQVVDEVVSGKLRASVNTLSSLGVKLVDPLIEVYGKLTQTLNSFWYEMKS
jgi:hypothetical protein